jgi:uncharacterized protein (TIGR03435 family)
MLHNVGNSEAMLKFLSFAMAASLSVEMHAQKKPEFEVASIKPSSPFGQGGCIGGPNSKDPNRIRCPHADLFFLIRYAYHLWNWEFKEQPWMHDQSFEVLANIPPGTTNDDFLKMLQSLLEQRFHLTYHRVPGHVEGYDMVIAKGGAKLVSSPQVRPPDEPLPVVPKDFPAAQKRGVSSSGNHRTMHINDLTMSDFAERIAGYLGAPITNRTGLDGKYDILLYWVSENAEESGPTLASALQSQLGLKLEAKKVDISIFVVDHADKTPTEN